eukprot:5396694-Alexandrium_andersonii.AAC.1
MSQSSLAMNHVPPADAPFAGRKMEMHVLPGDDNQTPPLLGINLREHGAVIDLQAGTFDFKDAPDDVHQLKLSAKG